MTIKSNIFIVIISSLFVFVILLNYQYFYDEYNVYAFKPSNAPSSDEKINVTKNETGKVQQQQSSNNKDKDSLAIDNNTTPADKNILSYQFIKSWGSEGTGDGQFFIPSGIDIDSYNDDVYVVDTGNSRIQKFDRNGNFITKWGSQGTRDGEFDYPTSIAVYSTDEVYVADPPTDHIQKFDTNGSFITKWGSEGSEDGQFSYPNDMVISPETDEVIWTDEVFVTDTANDRIQVFDSDGNFITKWGSMGTEDGQFDDPIGIAIDSQDNVYVVDSDNNRIHIFALSPHVLINWEGIPQINISNDASELNFEGEKLYGVNNFQQAIKWFDKALEIDPDYVAALYNKGNALIQLGKYQDAIKWFDKALEIDPTNNLALYGKNKALNNQ